MNEEVFNMQIRKFLKKVGIQSQREIEQAVKQSIEKSSLDWYREVGKFCPS